MSEERNLELTSETSECPEKNASKDSSAKRKHSDSDEKNIDNKKLCEEGLQSAKDDQQQQLTRPDDQTPCQSSSQQANSVVTSLTRCVMNNPTFNIAAHDLYVNPSTEQPSDKESEDVNPPTEKPSDKESEEEKLQRAADEIQKEQLELNEPDVVLRDPKLNQTEFPKENVVHPTMAESNIFDEEEPQSEELVPSTSREQRQKFERSKSIQFKDLLATIMEIRFLALVGPPGCGKTTLAKRLAKSFEWPNFFVIFLKFMELGHTSKLSLRQILIDNQFAHASQTIRNNAFKWMLKNDRKCVFIIDGYDQWNFSLHKENPLKVPYDSLLPVQQLIANLCSKTFFPRSKLIFTSRPHSIRSIPHQFRPELTVSVGELPTEGMRILFRHFAGEKGDNLLETLNTQTPQLFELCHNPLLMQFVVSAGLQDGWANDKTITKVFEAVLHKLQDFARSSKRNIHSILTGVSKMAFEGMERQSVVFTDDDLINNKLDCVNVQDIVINISRHQNVFEGEKTYFYFTHQTLQEFFAAVHIWKFMAIADFDQFIHHVVHESHWAMVRRFVCGLLLGDGGGTQTYKDKADRLRKEFVEFIQTDVRGYQMIDLLTDIQECSDGEKNFLAKFLPAEFVFDNTPISSTAAHALAKILPKLNRPVEELNLTACNLNSDSLKLICEAICEMENKMEVLDLSFNEFGDKEVEIISGCLNKVRWLGLDGCGISAAGLKVLCEKIKNLETPMELLDLSGNKFGDEGAEIISGCLNKVRELWLWFCGISAAGKQILRDELERLGLPLSTIMGLWSVMD